MLKHKVYMQKFSIYHKSKRFHPTTNQIFYTFNIVIIIIWIVLEKIIKTKEYNHFFGFSIGISLLIAISLMLIGKVKSPPLRGKLDGFISFDKNRIIVNHEVFYLTDIKIIKITNDDYFGKIKYLGKGDFNASFSNGVDNELLIELNNSEVKLYNFEIYNSDDFQKVKNELVVYYLNEKLEFSILLNLLGLEEKEEIDNFKKYCKYIAANSGLDCKF